MGAAILPCALSVQYAQLARQPHPTRNAEQNALQGEASGMGLGGQQPGGHSRNPFKRDGEHVSAGGDRLQLSRRMAKEPQFGATSPLIQNSPLGLASPEFEAKADKAIKSLPAFVQKGFERGGVHVVIAKFLTDAFPQLKGVVPRGWDPWMTWDNSDALASNPEIGMAEFSWASTVPRDGSSFAKMKLLPRSQYVTPAVTKPNNMLVKNTATEFVLRHEAGHVVDDLLADASDSSPFAMAYLRDLVKMTPADKAECYYYIQPDAAGSPTSGGRSEAFAEAFAQLYGGGCNEKSSFQKHFKNLLGFTEQAMKGWEKTLAATPGSDSDVA